MPLNLWVTVFVASALFVACANSTTPEPVGGETHFLQGCDGEGSCGLGLDCVCGVCTKPCVTDNSCKDQSTLATCESAGTPIGACDNPQASPVCDVQCDLDSECTALGSSYTCESGSCRKITTGSCVAGGVIYTDGDQYSLDGCNTCTCTNGTFNCTGLVCMDAGMDASVAAGRDGGMDSGVDGSVDKDAQVDATTDSSSAVACAFDGGDYGDDTWFTLGCRTCHCRAGTVDCYDVGCSGCLGIGDAGTLTIDVSPQYAPESACDLSAYPAVEVMAEYDWNINSMMLSDDSVYWFGDTDPSPHRTLKDTAATTPTYFYGGWSDGISDAYVEGCLLYQAVSYVDVVDIMVSPTDQQGETRLASVPGTLNSQIAVDAETVYFSAGSTLYSVPKFGGPLTRLADLGSMPIELVLLGRRLHWLYNDDDQTTANDAVRFIALDSSATPSTLATGLASPRWMEARGQALYVATRGRFDALSNRVEDGAIVRIANTGARTTLATLPTHVSAFTTDDTHAYWYAENGLHRVPLDGSSSATTLSLSLPGFTHLAADAAHIYGVAQCASTASSAIVRMLKP